MTLGKGQMQTAESTYHATLQVHCISTENLSVIKVFWYKVGMTCASVEQNSPQLNSG